MEKSTKTTTPPVEETRPTVPAEAVSKADPGVDSSDTEKGTLTEAEGVPEAPSSSPRNVSGYKWGIVVAAILSSTFLFALDNTVVADVQPRIVTQFNAVDRISWLSVAFVMPPAGLSLLYGQLYSQLLPKWLYIVSVIIFEVGSVVCGAAHDMSTMIVGRALCGLGGVGMYLGVMTMLATTTTIQERPMYMAGVGFTWSLGTVLGPVIGGAFADSSATWRWAFYINLVIGGVFAPVYLFLLPSPDPVPGKSLWARLRACDWVGATLFLAFVVCLIMAINFGGIQYGWGSGQEIALFVLTGVFLVIFFVQQAFSIGVNKANRLWPIELMTSPQSRRTVTIMFCTTAAGGTALFIPVYFIPLFFQFTRGDSAVEAAVRLLPFILLGIFITLVQGAVLSHPSGKYGFYMPWFAVGGCLAIIGGVLLYKVDINTGNPWANGAAALTGTGVGMFVQVGFSIAQASSPTELQAICAAFIALAQVGGIALGLAIANSVFVNETTQKLRAILPDSVSNDQIEAALAGVGSDFIKTMPGPVQLEVLQAIVKAISRSYILLITAAAFVVVMSAVMKREKLFLAAGGGGI